MEKNYNRTVTACFFGYIVQAIIVNFAPLLFVTFQNTYGMPLSQITLLVTVNFCTQLLVDLISVKIVDKLGYRTCMVAAHLFCSAGLFLLTVLPEILPPLVGILIAVILYAIGGGLLEVLVSPTVEACPSERKAQRMSLLHSFYCWGHMGVVLLSTLYFKIFGIENWKYLAYFWAIVPLYNAIVFTKVPFAPLLSDGQTAMPLKDLFSRKLFWLLLVMMICSGASEQAVAQWASTFAEEALGVSKTLGDLAGPMMFAICMGCSRALYGKVGDKLNLERSLLLSSLLCIASYFIISLSPIPILSLVGCGICGFSVGLMWPGSFSISSKRLPLGGTSMFALLALGGDVGCSGGPTLVGFLSSAMGDNLKKGILFALIFPVSMTICLLILKKGRKSTV